ncbi:MarR family winged helix-turn-helix transcriptional regulator [Granulicella arctica]|uniref:MarR family winged helix-turn-helix transcriptional regulator n=1 Tax=Granulicella arctica TaxID=940613 RepID=UPI0021DF93E4|nr:MarR family transcriptional regulator [Granulicella arctica]
MKKANNASKTGQRSNSMGDPGNEFVNMLTDPLETLNDDARRFRRFTRAVFAAHAAVLKHGDAMNARYQQSAARWRVLIRVGLGDVSASAIAKVTGYSRQSVNRLLAELQTEGLVRTSADLTDLRRLRPQLTKKGREVLIGMESGFNVWAEELVVRLEASRLEQTSMFLEEAVILLQREEEAAKERGVH